MSTASDRGRHPEGRPGERDTDTGERWPRRRGRGGRDAFGGGLEGSGNTALGGRK